mmetsp:Transcript_3851/g.5729  ORF Transcript_3851/g.5729 Transcript_3851/m.5729 type:complete len:141 (+) Transcript_3851:1059-1481(+)
MGVTPASIEEMQKSKPKLRIDKLLHDYAVPMPKVFGEHNAGYKNIILRFLLNPIKFIASPTDSSSVAAVLCERTRLQGNVGNIKAVGTGRLEELKANMVGLISFFLASFSLFLLALLVCDLFCVIVVCRFWLVLGTKVSH